jgi:threonine synthase
VYKAFYDLKMSGLIEKLPRLVCVQAEKSNAIHNFITTGIYKNADNPKTVADSISVSIPSNAYMAKKAVEDSQGFSVIVSDKEILLAQKFLASKTGIFAEPSSSAVAAALEKLKKSDILDKKEQIVLLITGNGLKDIESVKPDL